MKTDRYQKTILDNGIRVVSEYLENTRSVAIGFWVAVGSRDENSRVNGISHLMEHMVFKGTSRRTAYDIAVSLEAYGGQLNAFTEKELTCFYAFVLDEQLPLAVGVLADLIQNSLLKSSDLQIEKEIISEEYRNLLDSPEDYIHDLFALKLFPKHSLGLPILGTLESVRSITRDTLEIFKSDYYHSDHLIVAAAGNINHEQLVTLLESHLMDFPRYSETIQSEEEQDEIHLPRTKSIQTHLCLGFPTVSYSDPRKFSLLAINSYLGSGMSSVLFQELREKKGWVYSIYSFTEYFRDTGLLGIYAGTENNQKNRVLEKLYAILAKLQDEGLTHQDLSRIQTQLVGGLILGMEDASNRMHRLAKMEHYLQAYVPLERVIDSINRLTCDDLFQTLKEMNINQNLSLVTIESR